MVLFKKKADPISQRARTLNAEIAALEAEIKRLDTSLHTNPPHPRLHHTTWPSGQQTGPALTHNAPLRESVFEPYEVCTGAAGLETSAPHYNEFGLRKYDLPAAWRRVRTFFYSPATHNPKLVSYLAAGSIKGLRPLRYEKRVARNRFIALLLVLVVLLWGIASMFF